MTHQEFADDLIEDRFDEVLNDWVDYDVQMALIKAMYKSVKLNQPKDAVMFLKSLVEEIDQAALQMTLPAFEDALARLPSWGNEADTRRSLQ